MTVRANLTNRGHHRADELVAELNVTTSAVQPQPDRRLDHSRDRLAISRHELSDPSIGPAIEPQPQHLTDFEHGDLPERHMHRLSGRQRQRR